MFRYHVHPFPSFQPTYILRFASSTCGSSTPQCSVQTDNPGKRIQRWYRTFSVLAGRANFCHDQHLDSFLPPSIFTPVCSSFCSQNGHLVDSGLCTFSWMLLWSKNDGNSCRTRSYTLRFPKSTQKSEILSRKRNGGSCLAWSSSHPRYVAIHVFLRSPNRFLELDESICDGGKWIDFDEQVL